MKHGLVTVCLNCVKRLVVIIRKLKKAIQPRKNEQILQYIQRVCLSCVTRLVAIIRKLKKALLPSQDERILQYMQRTEMIQDKIIMGRESTSASIIIDMGLSSFKKIANFASHKRESYSLDGRKTPVNALLREYSPDFVISETRSALDRMYKQYCELRYKQELLFAFFALYYRSILALSVLCASGTARKIGNNSGATETHKINMSGIEVLPSLALTKPRYIAILNVDVTKLLDTLKCSTFYSNGTKETLI